MRSTFTLLIIGLLPICLLGQNEDIPNYGSIGESFQFVGLVPTNNGFTGVAHGRSNGKLDNDVILFQISNDGEILDSTVLVKEDIQEVNTITFFDDGFFIIGGMTDDQPTGEGEAYLMGFENDGTLAWELIYSGEKEDRILRAGKISETEVVFLIGYETGQLEVEKAIIKVSKTGDLLWSIEPNLAFNLYDRILSIRGDNQGNILITGINNFTGFVRSYDSNGNQNWEINELLSDTQTFDAVYDLWFDENQDRYLVLMLSSPTIAGSNSLTVGHLDMEGNLLDTQIGFDPDGSSSWAGPAPYSIIAALDNEDHFYISDQFGIVEWLISPDLSEIEFIGTPLSAPEAGPRNLGFDMFYNNESLIYSTKQGIFGAYNPSSDQVVFQTALSITAGGINESVIKHSVNNDGDLYFRNNFTDIVKWNPDGAIIQQLEPSAPDFAIKQADISVLENENIVLAYFESATGDPIKYDLFNEEGTLLNTVSVTDLDIPFSSEVHTEPLADGGFIAAYTNIPFLSLSPFHYFVQADANGNLINEFDLSSLDLLYFQKMMPTPDQHLLLLGVSENEAAFRLVKVSLDGNVIWDQQYPVSGFAKVRGYGLSISPDGNTYAFSGGVSDDETAAIYWAEVDKDGNTLRSGIVDEQEALQHENSFIHYKTSEDILIFSSAHNCIANPDSEAYYMGYWQVDGNDNVTEFAKYFSAYPLVANDSEWLPDGRLSISGYERLWNEQDFFAVILDENGLVGVGEELLFSINDFRLSPNPTTGPLQLSLNNTYQGPIQMQIGTIDGQIIHAIDTEKLTQEWQYEWDAKHLPKGSYYIKIMTKEGGVSKLWVKQ